MVNVLHNAQLPILQSRQTLLDSSLERGSLGLIHFFVKPELTTLNVQCELEIKRQLASSALAIKRCKSEADMLQNSLVAHILIYDKLII